MTDFAVFHCAFPVDDLDAARAFYTGALGCAEVRSTDAAVHFDLYGHLIVAQRLDAPRATPPADVPHFGMLLDAAAFDALAARLRAAGTAFEVEPHVPDSGLPGEVGSMFLRDPAGNALEFKAFRDRGAVFGVAG